MKKYFILILIVVSGRFSYGQDRALFLSTGDDIARVTLDLIESAEKEIISDEFLMRDDEFGRMKMALLAKKAKEGVKVYMQVDALHLLVNPAYIVALQNAGVVVRNYNPIVRHIHLGLLHRNHSKVLVIDGKRMRTGDSNTGNEYVQWGDGHQMESRDIYVEGAAAQQARLYGLNIIFSKLARIPSLAIASTDAVTEQRAQIQKSIDRNTRILKTLRLGVDAPELLSLPPVRFVTQEEVVEAEAKLAAALGEIEVLRRQKNWTPMEWEKTAIPVDKTVFLHDPIDHKGKNPGMEVEVYKFIASAEKQLVAQNAYFYLTPKAKAAMNTAMDNGAEIIAMTNSLKSSDNRTVQSGYEYRTEEYARLGLQLWEADSTETWHSKTFLRDGYHVLGGGFNLDPRSENKNMETGVYVAGREFADAVGKQLDTDRRTYNKVAEGGKLLKTLGQKTIRSCRSVFVGAPKLTSPWVIQLIKGQL